IAEQDEDISSLLEADIEEPKDDEVISAVESNTDTASVEKPKKVGRVKASPIARKLAEENNIDLSLVTGTGPNGRIVLEDVEEYLKTSSKKIKASPMAEKIAEQNQVDLS